MQQSVFYCLFK